MGFFANNKIVIVAVSLIKKQTMKNLIKKQTMKNLIIKYTLRVINVVIVILLATVLGYSAGDPIPGLDISLSTEYKVHYKVTAVSKENNDICIQLKCHHQCIYMFQIHLHQTMMG
jgi:hypothetical protein